MIIQFKSKPRWLHDGKEQRVHDGRAHHSLMQGAHLIEEVVWVWLLLHGFGMILDYVSLKGDQMA